MHGGRAHIEVRAVHLPDHEALVKDLIARLGDIEGVQWAEVNAAIGRVIVDFDPEGPDLGDLLDVVEAVERHHEVVEERFPKDRAEHPADIEPLRRAAVSLGADVAGLTFSVFGQLLRVTPFPVELASLVSLAEQQPRLREFFERMVGAPATDLGLGVTSALAQAVALGPFGLAVDISLRCQQVSELRARRAAWARLEPELFSGPMAVRTIPLDVVDRPVKLRQGPIERYADRTTLASLAAFGVALPLTGSPRRAAGLVVAGPPRPRAWDGRPLPRSWDASCRDETSSWWTRRLSGGSIASTTSWSTPERCSAGRRSKPSRPSGPGRTRCAPS